MNTVSELRKSLANIGGDAGLSEAQIEAIVAKAVADGTVTDDTATTELDPDMIKSLVGEMSEALKSAATPNEEAMAKAGGVTAASVDEDGEYVDIAATLATVVDATNSMASVFKSYAASSQRQINELSKGLLAVGKLVEAQVGQATNIGKSQADIAAQQQAISQHLKMPVRPRAQTGATAIPHPGEAVEKGGTVTHIGAAGDKRSLMVKAQGRIRTLSEDRGNPGAENEIQALARAVTALESGLPVDQICAEIPAFAALVA